MLTPPSFKSQQQRFPRVREAYNEKLAEVKKLCTSAGINLEKISLYFRVFKSESVLEIWAKKSTSKYILLKSYPICGMSGTLGPKRREGDLQVPEGFYHIDRFNPNSAFFLSLGINYPNGSDKKIADPTRPGGDIFIHGDCVSIGCMAMTTPTIKEIYLLAVEAKNAGQNSIPVHIFPCRMTDENLNKLKNENDFSSLIPFWQNLKIGYDYFEKNNTPVQVRVDSKGKYIYE